MAALLVLFASEAGAQFRQYTRPGGPGERAAGSEEEIERTLDDARWRLGPIRLVPTFGLRQLQYVDNAFAGAGDDQERISDLTVTVGAGLTAYLPTGGDVYWMLEASPEFVWWRDLTERRQFTGRYGAGVFAFFNRLELEVTAGREEAQGVASAEFPQLTVTRRDHLDARAGLRLTGKVDLALSAGWSEYSDQSDETDDPRVPAFARLDREERIVRAALGYRITRRTRIALGVERTESNSAAAAQDLSATGTAPTLEVDVQGARTELTLVVARRSLEPEGTSRFAPYDAVNGDASITWRPRPRLGVQLYGSVHPALSLLDDYSHYEERRAGVALLSTRSRRVAVALFAERGENRYQRSRPDAPERTDDARSYGAQVDLSLRRSFTLKLRAQRDQFDSAQPGGDRDVTSVQTAIALTTSRLLWR